MEYNIPTSPLVNWFIMNLFAPLPFLIYPLFILLQVEFINDPRVEAKPTIGLFFEVRGASLNTGWDFADGRKSTTYHGIIILFQIAL